MSNYLARLIARSRPSADVVRPRVGSRFEQASPESLESGSAVSGWPLAPLSDAEPATTMPSPKQHVERTSDITPATPADESKTIEPLLRSAPGIVASQSASSSPDMHEPGQPSPSIQPSSEPAPAEPTTPVVQRSLESHANDPQQRPPMLEQTELNMGEQSHPSAITPRRGPIPDGAEPAHTIISQAPEAGSMGPGAPHQTPRQGATANESNAALPDAPASRAVPRRGSHPKDNTANVMVPDATVHPLPRPLNQTLDARAEEPTGTETPIGPAPAIVPGSHEVATVDSETKRPTRLRRGANMLAEAAEANRSSASTVTDLESDTPVFSAPAKTEEPEPRSSPEPRTKLVAKSATPESTPQNSFRAAEPPTIRVTIGRVEVRAVMPPRPPAARPPSPPPKPSLSLAEYLQQRSGGKR